MERRHGVFCFAGRLGGDGFVLEYRVTDLAMGCRPS